MNGTFKNIAWGLIGIAVIIGLALLLIRNESDKESIKLAQQCAAGIGLAFLVVGSGVLLMDKDALRDSCTVNGAKPFSFSRVQMWWWTFIILGCYLGIYATTGEHWSMNQTCLILLGISGVTTAGARMIDNNQTNDANTTRHQDSHVSQGLLRDILSDENGMSIHRFQSLIFNIAYGLSFVVEVFSDINKNAFPVYDATVLTLLGVSSGTYIVMKMNENQTAVAPAAPPANNPVQPVNNPVPPVNNNNPVPPANNVNDELIDANPNPDQPQDH
ncbi:MAG: hypothetical protein FD123_2870 [Bacteroidetes bacterium]|nr:MAG: hypothetical protein FD123_2870 [Bacteroidota bacterium]